MYDKKQLHLIASWIKISEEDNLDTYSRFIALWIAFNAACYARYANVANKARADLRKDAGLALLTGTETRTEGSIRKQGLRITIDLAEPGRITIDVTERYTEDIVFSEFAKEYGEPYKSWISEQTFSDAVSSFRDSLAKSGRHYVINMVRASEHSSNADFEWMKGRNIIVAFEDIKSLKELKNVLYQVRCNIFHGEKVPGEANDDRITRSALPVLRKLVNAMIPGAT